MSRTLVLSVGGSPAPLQTALRILRPDRVIFVVSDGDGGAKSSCDMVKNKRISYQARGETKETTGLLFSEGCPQSHKIQGVPADDPGRVLALTEGIIGQEIAAGQEVTVDYTGGTKSMTAGLVLAATAHEDVRLQFMVGRREDLVRVRVGTEQPVEIPQQLMGLAQIFTTVRHLVSRRNYGAAHAVLDNANEDVKRCKESSVKPPGIWRKRITQWRYWLAILDQWDRFDHAGALRAWENGDKRGDPFARALDKAGLVPRLKVLADSASKLSAELVEDLWLNAQRRADLGLYDDAVARLYRLSEAAVQVRLFRKHGIDTSRVPPSKVPDKIKRGLSPRTDRKTGDGEEYFALPLSKSRQLLESLDPGDTLVTGWGEKGFGWQGQRNHSILAHGFKPLDQNTCQQARDWFEQRKAILWEELLGRPTETQLPNVIPPML